MGNFIFRDNHGKFLFPSSGWSWKSTQPKTTFVRWAQKFSKLKENLMLSTFQLWTVTTTLQARTTCPDQWSLFAFQPDSSHLLSCVLTSVPCGIIKHRSCFVVVIVYLNTSWCWCLYSTASKCTSYLWIYSDIYIICLYHTGWPKGYCISGMNMELVIFILLRYLV